MTRAGIYARISSDRDDTQLGVERQIEDCTALAIRRNWTIVEIYKDNDVSATRSRVRPAYERLISDIKSGHIEAFLVWDVDRLTRTPRELEDIIDLADRHNLKLASVGGDVDLATPQGRLTARVKGSVARHETDQASRRLKRKFEERAQTGQPHGRVPFGYQRYKDANGTSKDVPHPIHGPLVVELAKKALAGESMIALARWMNNTGVTAPRGGQWSTAQIRQMLLRPSNAGLRQHAGEIVGKTNGEGLYSEETHYRLVEKLTDPERLTSKRGNTTRHLLSGLAICGKCGGRMRRLKGSRNRKTGKVLQPAYACSECHGIRRRQEPVEEVVNEMIIGLLERPDIQTKLSAGDPKVLTEAREKVASIEARLLTAADLFADGTITGEQLARSTSKLRTELDAARARLTALQPADDISQVAGVDAREKWAAAPFDVRRAVIDRLVKIRIMPAPTGALFDPSLIEFTFKFADDYVESLPRIDRRNGRSLKPLPQIKHVPELP